MGFKYVYFSSHGSGRWSGVAILIFSAVNHAHIFKYRDIEDRFVMTIGKMMSLFDVPPGSDWSFLHFF